MAATTSAKGLYPALLAVQQEVPQLRTDATAKVTGVSKGGKPYEYSYKYLTLGSLLGAVLPVLHAHEVVVVQGTTEVNGHPALRTKLVHAPTGESMEDTTPLLLSAGADSQAWGAAVTYTRRYALITMLGLSAEDDDGQSARAKPQAQGQTTNGDGDSGFVAPVGRKITDARRKKLKALIDQMLTAKNEDGDPLIRPEHIEHWCQSQNPPTSWDELKGPEADRLEESLLKLAKNSGLVPA